MSQMLCFIGHVIYSSMKYFSLVLSLCELPLKILRYRAGNFVKEMLENFVGPFRVGSSQSRKWALRAKLSQRTLNPPFHV